MIQPPNEMGLFQFVTIASLRAGQLMRGCRPRVDGDHTTAILAQLEVAEQQVMPSPAIAESPAQRIR